MPCFFHLDQKWTQSQKHKRQRWAKLPNSFKEFLFAWASIPSILLNSFIVPFTHSCVHRKHALSKHDVHGTRDPELNSKCDVPLWTSGPREQSAPRGTLPRSPFKGGLVVPAA